MQPIWVEVIETIKAIENCNAQFCSHEALAVQLTHILKHPENTPTFLTLGQK